ncbi:beta-2-microglobulin-like, partial [Rhincodon typus]|uniref:beta-2-microglobulin-like n=1 Tax=Rhincodon typus TaxID=259920 RepID=UPI00202EA404
QYFERKGIYFSFDPKFYFNFTDQTNHNPIPFCVCLLFVFSPFPITVQPEVFISRSESNSQDKPLTLSCLVTGFYPVDIEVNWLRNGEVMSETQSSGIRPNHDGTHQIQKEIEINAGDEDQYSFQIDHCSLSEAKLYQWETPGNSGEHIHLGMILGFLFAAVFWIIVMIIWIRSWKD